MSYASNLTLPLLIRREITRLLATIYIQTIWIQLRYFGFESYQHQKQRDLILIYIADLPNEGCTDLNNARSFPINP